MRVAVALLLLCLSLAAAAAESAPLFAAQLMDLDGQPAVLSALRGKPLVVNFWARWCGPCKEEIPDLVRANAKYKARGLTVVGIGLDDQIGSVRDFVKAYDIDYKILLARDEGIPLLRAVGNDAAALPYTLVIDRRGKVVAHKLGIMSEADMDVAFERALQR